MNVAIGAEAIGAPSVPTIGKTETASVPWVTTAVEGGARVTGPNGAMVTAIVMPGTKVVSVYVPPAKSTVLVMV